MVYRANINDIGAIIPVEIIPVADLPNLSGETGVEVKALIDTGSFHTSIYKSIFDGLKIKSIGSYTLTNTIVGRIERTEYLVRMVLGNGNDQFEIDVLKVHDFPWFQGYHCVLGHDVLSLGVLTFNGKAGTFQFEI